MQERIIGFVKWFNAVKGYGFIGREDGDDVFVHHASIRMRGFRKLTVQQRVEFTLREGPQGLLAEDVVPLPDEVE